MASSIRLSFWGPFIVTLWTLGGHYAAASDMADENIGEAAPVTAGEKTPGGEEGAADADAMLELVDTEGLGLTDIVIAKGVESRQPVDAGTVFQLGNFEKIYAFLVVNNPGETADEISVSWAPEGGRERGSVNVTVGPQKRWRTWAFSKTTKKVGKWQVIVRNSEGMVIGRASFEIQPNVPN